MPERNSNCVDWAIYDVHLRHLTLQFQVSKFINICMVACTKKLFFTVLEWVRTRESGSESESTRPESESESESIRPDRVRVHQVWVRVHWTRVRARGGTDLERGYGDVPRSWPPFFRPPGAHKPTNLPSLRRSYAPPFSNFRKFFNFQPCFGQNFSSQEANFPNFRSLDPSFFKENPLPRHYFWKPVWHTPTKKIWVPPPESESKSESSGSESESESSGSESESASPTKVRVSPDLSPDSAWTH